jgi:hypothetical protein
MKIKYNHWLPKFLDVGGIVIYPYILYSLKEGKVPESLHRHELEHIKQVEREGWLKFYLTYLWYQVKYGYEKNPYEIEARKAEEQWENVPR